MKIKSLENIEQVKNAQIGDVLPILNQGDWVDGRMMGMVEKKNGEGITFIGQHVNGAYLRYDIKDIKKETGIIKSKLMTENDVVRFWFNAYVDTPNATQEEVNENNPIVKKYQELIK
jgi:hypothetical protein